ncbi:MAG: PilZ domain-containing protein [Bacillota bacterium]
MGKDLISTVLKEGMIINTKLSSSNVWLQNIVYAADSHSVSVALLNAYLENVIMIGQSIFIKYSSEQTELLFEGEIVKISPEFPSYITINISSVRELKNSRVFPRHDVYLASTIKTSDLQKEYFAIIHNVSLVGMAFYSRDHFEPGEKQLELSIYLPNKKIIIAKGRITRKIPQNSFIDYGMQYTEMSEESNNILSSFFSSLEDEKIRLREEFVNCIKKHL